MRNNRLILFATAIVFISFIISQDKIFTFSFPKRKYIELKITAPSTWTISNEKKGEDVYYSNFSKATNNDILFSILFFKLNDNEQKTLVGNMGLEGSPLLPTTYFLSNNKTAEIESNNTTWNDSSFCFRDFDIEELDGSIVHQKNMKAYCMYDKDLFVQIHLSKSNYSPGDSLEMRMILNSLRK